MQHRNRWILAILILIIVTLQLSACSLAPGSQASTDNSYSPAKVVRIGQTSFNEVILTADAAKRLDIQTDVISDTQVGDTLRKVVPYSAIFYDLHGATWVYTNPKPLTFVRASVIVDSINDNQVLLSDGPSSGTVVVTVGDPELYGTEFPGGLQP